MWTQVVLIMVLVMGFGCYGYKSYGTPFDPRHLQRGERSATANLVPPANNKDINAKWNATFTDMLKRDLLLNYDKFARPMHHNNVTSVTLDPTIHHVELDEARSVMTVHCWIKMSWQDDKLKWTPSEYGGLDEIHLADHEIWQPDVFPYNSATGSSIDHYGNTNCIAQSDGTVLWVPPSILHVFCDLNLRKWPFDTQVCSMKIGSWTYSGKQIDLTFSPHDTEFENIVPNAEWKFIKIDKERHVVTYECCVEPYIDLTFNLTLERRSPAYKALVVTPATAFVLMTLATFWLPPTSSDKIVLGGISIIIICIYLVYFTQKLSVMAGHPPLIVMFYSSSLYLASFSVVLAVIVINLSKTHRVSPVPWLLKTHLTGWVGRYLLLGDFSTQTTTLKSLGRATRSDEQTDTDPVFAEDNQELKTTQQDWVMLAVAIDRIAFLVYCFLFIVFAIAYAI